MLTTPLSVDEAFQMITARLRESYLESAQASAARQAADIDTASLADTLNYVTEHPEEHDQALWTQRRTDGTIVGCVAYHAARLAGYVVDPRTVRDDGQTAYVMRADGTRHLHEAAQHALGLTTTQADRLFAPFNTVDRLWALAAEFTGGRVTRP